MATGKGEPREGCTVGDKPSLRIHRQSAAAAARAIAECVDALAAKTLPGLQLICEMGHFVLWRW